MRSPQPLRRHPEARQGKLPALRPQGLVQVSPLRYGFQDPPGTEDAHRGEALRGPLQVLRLSRRLQDGRRLPSALEQETQHQQRLPSVKHRLHKPATVFKKKQLLLEHFHQNAGKRVTSVFKCPECNSVFPQKHLLMQHFKSVHIGNVSAEAENRIVRRNGKEWRRHGGAFRKKAEQDGRARAKPTGWTCGECLQWFPERDSYVSHVKTAHSKSAKKYPCRHCEQSFTSRTGLRRHNRTSHDGKKRAYTCW
uniref:C2H2-type domain-containing protein n=1 Tax=Tetraodon nigroviridis TaxID=99883 RepID=H3CJI8_TETNG